MQITPVYQPPADQKEFCFTIALLAHLNFSFQPMSPCSKCCSTNLLWDEHPYRGPSPKIKQKNETNYFLCIQLSLKQEVVNNPTHFAHPSRPVSVPPHGVTQNLLQLPVLHFVCLTVPSEIQLQENRYSDSKITNN